MRAMILAAGRGERMRPLTDVLPKPLLKVANKELIVWHIERLAALGFKDIVINIAHLGFKIPQLLESGLRWNVNIEYSDEQEEGALESAGGIIKALPLLGNEPFLVVNGDIWCDYMFDSSFTLESGKLGHIILVANPDHNTHGDFALIDGKVMQNGGTKYTFSGIGYYSAKLFDGLEYGKRGLGQVLRDAMDNNLVSGEVYSGVWMDIGTPQRLEEINRSLDTID